jgi:hypothetical protein
LASGNAHVTDPVTENESPLTSPEYVGVPVTETEVVPSKPLSAAERPVIVRALAETALPLAAVTMLTLVAPVLDRTMFWEL